MVCVMVCVTVCVMVCSSTSRPTSGGGGGRSSSTSTTAHPSTHPQAIALSLSLSLSRSNRTRRTSLLGVRVSVAVLARSDGRRPLLRSLESRTEDTRKRMKLHLSPSSVVVMPRRARTMYDARWRHHDTRGVMRTGRPGRPRAAWGACVRACVRAARRRRW